jgi:hypothetical protein
VPNGLLPDEGIDDQLRRIIAPGFGTSNSWRCILWVNDLVPDNNTVLASLTPATFPGYSFVTLMPGTWTVPDVVDGCATSTYGTTPLQWIVSGPTTETVYGYALTDPTAGVLRFIQRFDDSDITPLAIGSRVVLLPQYTLTSAACGSMLLARRSRKRRAKKGV